MTFFECQTELPQPFPEAADADLHIVFRQEPGLQFGKRRIGFAHNAGTKSFVIRSKLRLGAACPGTGARLSRLLPTSQNFVDIGHADPEDGRSGISARSRIHCRHHPFAQVLRVSSPHTVPPSNQRREGIKNSAPMEYASDSINSEGALGHIRRKQNRVRSLLRFTLLEQFAALPGWLHRNVSAASCSGKTLD